MKYAPELDGLRAICVLFTLLNHIGPHPAVLNGTVGVDVFFALSGFLITTLLIRDRVTSEGGKACAGSTSGGCFGIVPALLRRIRTLRGRGWCCCTRPDCKMTPISR